MSLKAPNCYPERRPSRYIPGAICHTILPAILLGAIFLSLPAPSRTQTRNMVVSPVDANRRVRMTGHHPAWAAIQNDLGAVPADLQMQHLEIVLARPPQVQRAFEQFFAAQQDPTSPDYHHWLTPAEVGARFGASDHDISAIADWLQSQNLHVDSISSSRARIAFSGPALAIGNAFGADMHYFNVNGEQRISIADEPQIPSALAGIVDGINGLYEVKIAPSHGARVVAVPVSGSQLNAVENDVPVLNGGGGTHFMAPADFAKIYDLPGGTVTGSGQTIAVIGRARVFNQDITNFQTLSGLTAQAPTVIIPPLGTDPGAALTAPPTSGSVSGDQSEATLDVTRTTSVAPGATIDLVVSANTQTSSGVQIASEYVVDATPVFAHVMSLSFSSCEGNAGPSGASFWNNLFSQAAVEGISVFVGSGDAGAAGCDAFFSAPPASQTLSTNVICASSYATCVGGTEFADSTPALYWATTEAAGHESALGYIPEGGWNEPIMGGGGPQAASSGGGFSLYIPTPSWQTGTGVPGTQGRYTPDVSFSASGHDGYFACLAAASASCVVTNGSFSFEYFFGTSASAPDMAGVAALLDQKFGAPQGNLNPNLYKLATTPSNNVFHDVTVATSGVSNCLVTTPSMCNNSTPSSTSQVGGLSGYLVGTGYDEVTGLGSIDVAKLLANWAGASTALASSLNPSIIGTSITFTATVTSAGGPTPTGSVTFLDNGASIGSGSLNASGVATFSISSLTVGSHPITAQYGGDQTYQAGVSNVLTQAVTLFPSTATITSSLNPSVGGQSITFTATVAGSGSTPSGTVTFFDGSSSIGTGTLSGGSATLVYSSLSTGAHSIAVSYAGDTKFSPSTSASLGQTVSVSAFGPPPTGLTVTAGSSLMIPLTLFQAAGSTLNFQLTCSGLPTKSTCAFSPSALVPGQPPSGTAIQVTFGTASSSVPGNPQQQGPLPWQGIGILTILAAGLAAGLTFMKVPRLRLAAGLGFATVILAVAMAGCGSSTPAPYTGTTKGASTLTVTATSGSTVATTSVAVTVQ